MQNESSLRAAWGYFNVRNARKSCRSVSKYLEPTTFGVWIFRAFQSGSDCTSTENQRATIAPTTRKHLIGYLSLMEHIMRYEFVSWLDFVSSPASALKPAPVVTKTGVQLRDI